MGILRDMFDMFIHMRNLRDDRRKEYFSQVVLDTFGRVRAVHDDLLSLWAESFAILDDSGDAQDVLNHFRKGRLRMQRARQEIYEKACVHVSYKEDKEVINWLAEDEYVDVRAFLFACRDYFETDEIYDHEISHMVHHLELLVEKLGDLERRHQSSSGADRAVSIGGEVTAAPATAITPANDRHGRSNDHYRMLLVSDIETQARYLKDLLESSLPRLSEKWQRVAREFAEVHRHFA